MARKKFKISKSLLARLAAIGVLAALGGFAIYQSGGEKPSEDDQQVAENSDDGDAKGSAEKEGGGKKKKSSSKKPTDDAADIKAVDTKAADKKESSVVSKPPSDKSRSFSKPPTSSYSIGDSKPKNSSFERPSADSQHSFSSSPKYDSNTRQASAELPTSDKLSADNDTALKPASQPGTRPGGTVASGASLQLPSSKPPTSMTDSDRSGDISKPASGSLAVPNSSPGYGSSYGNSASLGDSATASNAASPSGTATLSDSSTPASTPGVATPGSGSSDSMLPTRQPSTSGTDSSLTDRTGAAIEAGSSVARPSGSNDLRSNGGSNSSMPSTGSGGYSIGDPNSSPTSPASDGVVQPSTRPSGDSNPSSLGTPGYSTSQPSTSNATSTGGYNSPYRNTSPASSASGEVSNPYSTSSSLGSSTGSTSNSLGDRPGSSPYGSSRLSDGNSSYGDSTNSARDAGIGSAQDPIESSPYGSATNRTNASSSTDSIRSRNDSLPNSSGSSNSNPYGAIPARSFSQEGNSASATRPSASASGSSPYGAESGYGNSGAAHGGSALGGATGGYGAGGSTANGTSIQPSGSAMLANSSASERAQNTPGGSELQGTQTPSVAIEKKAPREIQVGRVANFETVVRNVGQVEATDVIVTDRIPAGTRLVSVEPQPISAEGGLLIWSLGSIKPGREVTISLNLMPERRGEIGSVAQVTFNAQASVRTICTKPELAIDSQAVEEVLIGDDIRINITVVNNGDGAASNVVIEEDVPAGVSHPEGREIQYPIGTLGPGERRELVLTMRAVSPQQVRNVISVRGDNDLFDEAVSNFAVVAPSLSIAMQGPNRRYLERTAIHRIELENKGTASATNVEIVARLPKGLKFEETNNHGTYDPATHSVYWGLESMPAGTADDSIRLVTLPVDTGEQIIDYQVTADLNINDNDRMPVLVEELAELFFDIDDVADPIEVDSETLYDLRVTNQGSKVATDVRIRVQFPDALEPLGATGPVEHAIRQQLIAFEPIESIAPGQEILLKLRARGRRAGDHRVVVELVSAESSEPVIKQASTKVYVDRIER